MNAIWISDYDYITDKIYKRPGCPKCKEPIGDSGDSYNCYSCGEVVEVTDESMKEWFGERAERKVEYRDCPKIEIDGDTIGCGGKGTVKTIFYKNPVTLEWQTAHGTCEKCKMRFIV